MKVNEAEEFIFMHKKTGTLRLIIIPLKLDPSRSTLYKLKCKHNWIMLGEL